jgi:endonuclease/exonuclease/phosphatase family metal-dependent hydrolase
MASLPTRANPIAFLFFAALMLISTVVHPEPLRVMTFNIRVPLDSDGPNRWEARRDLVVDMLRAEAPDVIGTQELFKHQGNEIVERLPQYVWFGIGRRGDDDDEHMGVFYRQDRLRLLASGNFWLSDTPDVPGSRTWGNVYPRMVTWARFERVGDGATFTLYNTHLPYRNEDEAARLRSAQLIRSRIAAWPADQNIIVTGDFNATPASAVYSILTETFSDAWLDARERSGPENTFHNFTGNADRRIDWILVRGPKVRSVKTVTTRNAERYPSDHFPVIAELELPPSRKSPE